MIERHDLTRLEAFSDAVFAFALTLLVVSLEVPKTSAELLELARGFLPFALSFAMICWIWYQHQQFLTRYEPRGAWVVALNCMLLFVVLFYVYPLKYITVQLVGPMVGMTDPATHQPLTGRIESGDTVLLLYSTGVILIFGLFLALHRHVWNERAALALGPEELLRLQGGMRGHAISAGLGVVSVAITLFGSVTGNGWLAMFGGLIYILMGPLHAWNGYANGKAIAALHTKATTVAKR